MTERRLVWVCLLEVLGVDGEVGDIVQIVGEDKGSNWEQEGHSREACIEEDKGAVGKENGENSVGMNLASFECT